MLRRPTLDDFLPKSAAQRAAQHTAARDRAAVRRFVRRRVVHCVSSVVLYVVMLLCMMPPRAFLAAAGGTIIANRAYRALRIEWTCVTARRVGLLLIIVPERVAADAAELRGLRLELACHRRSVIAVGSVAVGKSRREPMPCVRTVVALPGVLEAKDGLRSNSQLRRRRPHGRA
jgi:hypothetical protein